MNQLIEKLKENDEDFEFYPTTKEIVKCIWDHRGEENHQHRYGFGDVLDIGAGSCNFKKFVEELNENSKEDYLKRNIKDYYVIEKSKILIDALEKDIIVLGVDFHENTLMDKKVDTIFCNPPYSEYEMWVKRIISESNCKEIYLVIPERWKKEDDIIELLKRTKYEYKVLGTFDFLNAERSARAIVDVVYIDEKYIRDDIGFDEWFDKTFTIEKKSDDFTFKSNKENIKNELVNAENKIEMLVKLYQQELNTLYKHFKAIAELDVDILNSIGVTVEKVKESLKFKHKNLKNIYWEYVFDNLDDITERLTTETRERMLKRFTMLKQIDFNAKNVYSLIIWVIKNANSYYDKQLIDFFEKLSSHENVKPYKSNLRIGTQNWRFFSENSHYTLDYRIICSRFHFENRYSWNKNIDEYQASEVINDICTIANNLGFKSTEKEIVKDYGTTCKVYRNKEVLFEYKVYKNGNTHIKFNKELMKAINVESSRLLGWISKVEDIKKEFCEEMGAGAEIYFKQNTFIGLCDSNIKLLK